MEKVLVLGNQGMLGHVLFKLLSNNNKNSRFTTIGINRSKNNTNKNSYYLDVLDFELLENFIDSHNPKYIVNCIGVLVEKSKKNPSLAIKINSLLPHFLNDISLKYNFKLVHISTDCVFNGQKGKYIESDLKTENNYYGLTKNLGEIDNNQNLTIRTSIIGPELKLRFTGLFNWIMSQNGKDVFGYSNAIWSGLTTIELSRFIIWILDKDYTGIVHATNNDQISKYDLIKLINKYFHLNINLINKEDYIIDKSLVNTKINDYKFPTYQNMIKFMKLWMDGEVNYPTN